MVLFSALSIIAVPGTPDYVTLALTLTFMVGVLELALGLARMGALVNFISHSVVGFTAGAALLIAAKQLKHFFGVTMDSGGHFHDILIQFGHQITAINLSATAVSLSTLLIGIAFKRWLPRVPYMIAAMVGGSLVAAGLDFLLGAEQTHIATVGALPASLPPLSAPALTLDNIKHLAPSALAVTLFALTEAVSIGRSLAARGGYRIDGSLFFGSVNHVEQAFDRLRTEHPEQKHLAVVASGINFVDLQGGHALAKEAERRKRDGGGFYLVGVKQGLWEAMERCGCMEATGARNVFQSRQAAIHGIYQKLDRSVCATCEQRIFNECRA